MGKKRWIFLIVIIFTLTACSSEKTANTEESSLINDAKWFMTMDEIRDLEGEEPIDEAAGYMMYDTEFFGLGAQIFYDFRDEVVLHDAMDAYERDALLNLKKWIEEEYDITLSTKDLYLDFFQVYMQTEKDNEDHQSSLDDLTKEEREEIAQYYLELGTMKAVEEKFSNLASNQPLIPFEEGRLFQIRVVFENPIDDKERSDLLEQLTEEYGQPFMSKEWSTYDEFWSLDQFSISIFSLAEAPMTVNYYPSYKAIVDTYDELD